jgi:hypothetical protein
MKQALGASADVEHLISTQVAFGELAAGLRWFCLDQFFTYFLMSIWSSDAA